MDMLNLCRRVNDSREKEKAINWREVKAMEYADAGDYEGAKTVLPDPQWKERPVRQRKSRMPVLSGSAGTCQARSC